MGWEQSTENLAGEHQENLTDSGEIYGKHQETMIVTNKYKEGPVNCPTNSWRLELSLAGMTGYARGFFLNMNYLARLLKQAEPTSLVNFLW